MKSLINALKGFMTNSTEMDWPEDIWNAGVDALREAEGKEWVELTAGEISDIWGMLEQTSNEERDAIEFGFAIESALRERNGD